jgi:uncharacterized protein (TIGR02466 family)
MNDIEFKIIQHSAIPIYRGRVTGKRFEDAQKELLTIVDELDAKEQWLSRDPHAGMWFSPKTPTQDLIYDRQCVAFSSILKDHVRAYVGSFNPEMADAPFVVADSWLTNTPRGYQAFFHKHGAVDLAGAYYVDADEDTGDFSLLHQQQAMATSKLFMEMTRESNYPPKTGEILLFPGWMDHAVSINRTNKRRISLAFNLQF